MADHAKLATKALEVKKKSTVSHTRKPERSQSMHSPVDRILHLQRTIGNQAVQRMMKSGALQAKLRIGQPNDKYEQEADRVADQVMPLVQRQIEPEEEGEETVQPKFLSGESPILQRQENEEEEEEEKLVRPKAENSQSREITPDLESRIKSLKGRGQTLPHSVRNFFEPRLGYDFSQVRVYTDSKAAETAKSINAKAFTTRRDVVFGEDQYAPNNPAGQRLLAHELTHVVQQTVDRNSTEVQRDEDDITKMCITNDWARNLNDFELEEQIHIVRRQIMTLNPKVPEYTAARQNLNILEAEAEERLFPPKKIEKKELSIRLDVYPEKPIDAAEALLGVYAKGREKRRETSAAISIEDLDDIFILLQVISDKIAENTGSKKVEPFLSELHVLGHGSPGRFGFGTYMYNSDNLKKIGKGRAEAYIKTNATIYLEGCDVAAGSEGEEFMYQMGRVFFGNKSGYIWGNTCPVLGTAGGITTCKPIKKKYPDDFKK